MQFACCIYSIYMSDTSFAYVNSSLESSIMHLHSKQCWHVLWAVSSYCIWVMSLECCVWQVLLQWNVSSPHYTRPRQACLPKFSQRLKIESGSPCLHCQSLLSINPCLAHATDVTITTKDRMTGLLCGIWWSRTTNWGRLFICNVLYRWNLFCIFFKIHNHSISALVIQIQT